MTQTILYTYLGTNGTITSPVHLEDIYYIRRVHLVADKGKLLTRDGKKLIKQTIVAEDSVNDWYEIDIPEGQE